LGWGKGGRQKKKRNGKKGERKVKRRGKEEERRGRENWLLFDGGVLEGAESGRRKGR
jgi:hypothetical protein